MVSESTQGKPGQSAGGVSSEFIVPQEVIEYIERKRLKVGFSFEDVWREEHHRAFTVAKLMQQDLLEKVKDALRKSREEGLAFEQFRKEIEPTLQRAGWWGTAQVVDPLTGALVNAQLGSPSRLKLIFDTNMRQSYMRQRWQDLNEAKDVIPYLQYRVGPSKEHREQHLAWDGLVLPQDDPFWRYAMPINGYGCRCYVQGISRTMLKRRGLSVSRSPKLTPTTYVNKRTGKRHRGFKEIDPGFEYNVGMVSDKKLEDIILGE